MNFTQSIKSDQINKTGYSFLSTHKMPGPCWDGTIDSDEEIRDPGPGEGNWGWARSQVNPARPAHVVLPAAPPAAGQPWVPAAVGIRSDVCRALLCAGNTGQGPREAEAAKAGGCGFEERTRAEKREQELRVLFNTHRCTAQGGTRVG